jgi:hypothetical protein
LQEAVSFVHQHRRKLHIAINTFAHPDGYARWQRAVDMAAQLGADALILADLAMLEYAAERYPHIERHVSVQASATNEEAISIIATLTSPAWSCRACCLFIRLSSLPASRQCRWKSLPLAACASWRKAAAIFPLT